MSPRPVLAFLIAVLLASLTGCTSIGALSPTSTPTSTSTATLDLAATQALQTEVAGTEQAHAAETAVVQQTAEAKAVRGQTATANAIAGKATLAVQSTASANRAATRTAATATGVARATEQVKPIYDYVVRLADEQVISTTKGRYTRIEDFEQEWAQINWYTWWRTILKPDNFIIRADAEWDSASTTANWFSSGCGFVFSENGEDNHYSSFLALDGHVYQYRVKNGIFTLLNDTYYGKVDTPSGSAELMLVVDNQVVTFYVNGKKVSRYQDASVRKGVLALTLNSGTNKDWGTRCKMTNIDVWELP